MTHPRRTRRTAFSLVELLIVIALMGIMAAAIIPSMSPSVRESLDAGARIVAADLDYVRSLAVTNNSTYEVTFDRTGNRYVIRHSGTRSALNALPQTPFRDLNDPPDQHIVRLDSLLSLQIPVKLAVAVTMSPGASQVNSVEFGPLGETTRAEETVIWLTAGVGAECRYMAVRVNPVTGLTTVGDFQKTKPPLVP